MQSLQIACHLHVICLKLISQRQLKQKLTTARRPDLHCDTTAKNLGGTAILATCFTTLDQLTSNGQARFVMQSWGLLLTWHMRFMDYASNLWLQQPLRYMCLPHTLGIQACIYAVTAVQGQQCAVSKARLVLACLLAAYPREETRPAFEEGWRCPRCQHLKQAHRTSWWIAQRFLLGWAWIPCQELLCCHRSKIGEACLQISLCLFVFMKVVDCMHSAWRVFATYNAHI